jgi:hypothetical protein
MKQAGKRPEPNDSEFKYKEQKTKPPDKVDDPPLSSNFQKQPDMEKAPVMYPHSKVSTMLPKRPLSPYIFFSQHVSPQF